MLAPTLPVIPAEAGIPFLPGLAQKMATGFQLSLE
jgi:hypothetical protein